MEAPDYFQPVAGVRIWRVAPNLWAQLGGLLWAPTVKEPWPTGEEYEATCGVKSQGDHTPPGAGCSCGLYAFYSPELAHEADYWPKLVNPHVNLPYARLVAGVVAASGDIELCEDGFRAERGRVAALFTSGASDDDLPMPRGVIANAYGASVIDPRDYLEFCERESMLVFG